MLLARRVALLAFLSVEVASVVFAADQTVGAAAKAPLNLASHAREDSGEVCTLSSLQRDGDEITLIAEHVASTYFPTSGQAL